MEDKEFIDLMVACGLEQIEPPIKYNRINLFGKLIFTEPEFECDRFVQYKIIGDLIIFPFNHNYIIPPYSCCNIFYKGTVRLIQLSSHIESRIVGLSVSNDVTSTIANYKASMQIFKFTEIKNTNISKVADYRNQYQDYFSVGTTLTNSSSITESAILHFKTHTIVPIPDDKKEYIRNKILANKIINN